MYGKDNRKFKAVLSQSPLQSHAKAEHFYLGLMYFLEFLLEYRSLKNCFIHMTKKKKSFNLKHGTGWTCIFLQRQIKKSKTPSNVDEMPCSQLGFFKFSVNKTTIHCHCKHSLATDKCSTKKVTLSDILDMSGNRQMTKTWQQKEIMSDSGMALGSWIDVPLLA